MIFQSLDEVIRSKFSSLKSEIQLVLSLKDMLENEMKSITVQKDLVQQDFFTLSEQHDALKAAYHSLSYESATTGSKSNNSDEVTSLQREVTTLKAVLAEQTSMIERLERDKQLAELASRSMNQYEQYNTELEEKIRIVTKEKDSLSFQHSNVLSELDQYKVLTEKLKGKIKELSKSSGDGKSQQDFYDTFEEVMKDEMLTMKYAFETKLKMAREESDALAKKHQQEIARIQASNSPFAALKR
jgi:Mg2+ and Co2+ transporter CorA